MSGPSDDIRLTRTFGAQVANLPVDLIRYGIQSLLLNSILTSDFSSGFLSHFNTTFFALFFNSVDLSFARAILSTALSLIESFFSFMSSFAASFFYFSNSDAAMIFVRFATPQLCILKRSTRRMPGSWNRNMS